jgi:hypothetical protein
MYFPNSFPINDKNLVIVAQVIEKGPGPELHFMTGQGELRIQRGWSDNSKKDKRHKTVYRKKIQAGKWINAVVFLKRSTKSDGRIKIWLDNKLVADEKGPNSFIDSYPKHVKGPYFKAGAYFGKQVRNKEYVLYFDEVRIATGSVDYKTVAISEEKPILTLPKAPMGLKIQKLVSH